MSIEATKRIELSEESKGALTEALTGVNDKREEAFVLLNAIPEVYLPDIVEYFRILTGLKKIENRQ
jgi:hypothetical protein